MKIIYHRINRSLSRLSKPIVVDLDGTLSDDTHRLHLYKQAKLAKDCDIAHTRFIEYHKLAYLDKPNQAVLELVNDWMNFPMHEIWIVTARPEWAFLETIKWLNHHLRKAPNMLAMRPDNNILPSPDLKYEFLDTCITGGICPGYHLIVDNSPFVTKKLSSLGDTLLFSNQSKE